MCLHLFSSLLIADKLGIQIHSDAPRGAGRGECRRHEYRGGANAIGVRTEGQTWVRVEVL